MCVCVCFWVLWKTVVSYRNEFISFLTPLLCLLPSLSFPFALFHPYPLWLWYPISFLLKLLLFPSSLFYFFLPFCIPSFCRSSSLVLCLAQDYVGECFKCILHCNCIGINYVGKDTYWYRTWKLLLCKESLPLDLSSLLVWDTGENNLLICSISSSLMSF